MADLPVENRIDLKDALDKLIRNKKDAVHVMIYITTKWRITENDIAAEVAILKLRSPNRIILTGRQN